MRSVSWLRHRGFSAQAFAADVDARHDDEQPPAMVAGRQDRLRLLAAQYAAFGGALPLDAPVTIDGANMHESLAGIVSPDDSAFCGGIPDSQTRNSVSCIG
jgi:hypothetical protein